MKSKAMARVLGAAISCLLLLTAACTSSAPTQEEIAASAQRPSRLFGAASVNPFLRDVSSAPVDPESPALVDRLVSQVNQGGSVGINITEYNTSFYVAPTDAARIRVAFDNCQDRPDVPPGLYDGPSHFVDVPVPPDARPADGSDANLTIWAPHSDQLWEFWKMHRAPTGEWSACWGGRIDNVSSSRGQFPHPYGSAASGLTTVGSMITIHEAESAHIEHAMSLGVMEVREASEFRHPATRSDGRSDDAGAIPMGTRFRLDPTVDVQSLDLPPLAKAIAEAAQKYGFIVSDTSTGTPSIGAESSNRREAETGQNPWDGALTGVPSYAQLEHFPWDRMQAVMPEPATRPTS